MDGKQLKNSILQWAIQGKLVPQDPNDEPAIELLHRINPQIRPITEDTPFDIPKSWRWCRIDDISNVCSARRVHKNDWRKSGIPFYRAREIGKLADNGYVDNELYIDKALYDAFSKSGVPQKGDLMITAVGTLGKVYIVQSEDLFYYKDASVICLQNKYSLCPKYLKHVIESPFFIGQYKQESQGTTVATLTMERFNKYLIPIPPLAEQQRIVARIEELMPLVERYAQAQASLDKLNGDIKDKLKKSILQEAIQGKLVPQDPNDEPASTLLHRINPSFTPPQYDEPLPQGWSVATMSMLCSLIDGEKIQGKEMINLDAKYLRGQQDGTVLKSGKYIPANSLIILVDGENSGEVFRAPIDGYQGSTFKKLVIDANMYEEYILQVINSHRSKLRGNKVGAAIPHLNKHLFREILVPIPPLAEQQRIVARIEELFAIVENINS